MADPELSRRPMRIVLLGAGGFIGRHILAELLAGGHAVTAIVRHRHGIDQAFPAARIIEKDLAQAVHADDWLSLLEDVDLVVNAAGLLRGRAMQAVHVDMPCALHAAAQACGVGRVVLISAISARCEVPTDYAQTKIAGEQVLRQSGVPWTILRPSLVYGDGSYGGTSVLRGLAGTPLVLPVPGKGDFAFTPIHVRDLARAVRIVCEDDRFLEQSLEPVGPETLSLRSLLLRYRAWLGFGPAPVLPVPMSLMRVLGRLGDLFGSGPIATNSLAQMVAGNEGDSTAFARRIGFAARSLDEALREPAQVQDRWHARLFFLAPAIKAALVILWIVSGFLGLFIDDGQAGAFVSSVGLSMTLAGPLRIVTSLLDLCVAVLVLADRRARWSTAAQLAMVLGYTLVLGTALPALWIDPLGPLLKNIPILLLILVHGAIGDRR